MAVAAGVEVWVLFKFSAVSISVPMPRALAQGPSKTDGVGLWPGAWGSVSNLGWHFPPWRPHC